jgi:hypothetical protein
MCAVGFVGFEGREKHKKKTEMEQANIQESDDGVRKGDRKKRKGEQIRDAREEDAPHAVSRAAGSRRNE